MADQPKKVTDAELAAAREKYRVEQEKRLSAGGREVIELTGLLARYLDDPRAPKPVVPRSPVQEENDVVIVGAGLAGLVLGAKLREQGVQNIRLIDVAADVGGVWYWNRYPGCMCDVESLIYMPLLEELNYIPTMRYASASEIFAHMQRIARHYNLYENALFQTFVNGAVWNEREARWKITTNQGDEIRARFVILANGPLSRLRLPDLPGIETYQGHSFHTSRWDYKYTGGDESSPLLGLSDKVVGIIGTGATGLQCVPPVARSAKHLYVFQRTPSTVAVRENRPIDQEWAKTLEPGWQAKRMRNFMAMITGYSDSEEDLVKDSWTAVYKHLVMPRTGLGDTQEKIRPNKSPEDAKRERELADLAWMEGIRSRVDEVVKNRNTANALKPWYQYFCKRPGFHDEYLYAFNRENVTLVDTEGRGVERAYPGGVVANGREYPLDCLIFATGFEVETDYTHRIGFEITGSDGVTLTRKWKNGIATLHGLMTRGFPNFFAIPGINHQSVAIVNFSDTIQENVRHVAYIIGELKRRNAKQFEVSEQAEAAWVKTILDRAVERKEFLAACTPGRGNNDGRIDLRPPQNVNFGGGPFELYEILKKWRDAGNLPGLEITY